VADAFAASEAGSGFHPMDLAEVLPDSWRPGVGDDGRFQMVPAIGGPDGHFVAAFRRET
jgi:hypothetical protein